MSPDKVIRKALAMKSFSLDGPDSADWKQSQFFMLHVQMGFSVRKWFLPLTVFVFSCNYIENHFTSENGSDDS